MTLPYGEHLDKMGNFGCFFCELFGLLRSGWWLSTSTPSHSTYIVYYGFTSLSTPSENLWRKYN